MLIFLVLLSKLSDYCWSFWWFYGVWPRPLLHLLVLYLELFVLYSWPCIFPSLNFDVAMLIFWSWFGSFFHVWTNISNGALDGGMVFDLDHLLIMIRAHVLLLVQASFLPCSSFSFLLLEILFISWFNYYKSFDGYDDNQPRPFFISLIFLLKLLFICWFSN